MKPLTDPIVEEVRKERAAFAARFNNDLDEIFRELKRQEQASERTFVSYPPRKPRTAGHARVVKEGDTPGSESV